MSAIFRRELGSYFTSAIGYVFLGVFYFFSGFYFFAGVLYVGSSDLTIVFESMFMIIMLLVRILTILLLSEDFKSGTDQLLLTSPIGLHRLVYGKFLAAFVVFVIGSLVTLVYALIVAAFAPVSWASIVGNVVGLILLGGALVAIGLFVSSLTRSQVIAAVGAFAVILVFMYMDAFASIIPVNWLENLFTQISFMGRYRNFTSGLLNIADILYFISMIVVFNFLTVRTLERKRWS